MAASLWCKGHRSCCGEESNPNANLSSLEKEVSEDGNAKEFAASGIVWARAGAM